MNNTKLKEAENEAVKYLLDNWGSTDTEVKINYLRLLKKILSGESKMFIDIWDKDNKAIKINKFDKDLINIEKYNDAVNKLVADYGIVLEGNRIKTDYYKIEFHKSDNDISYKYWFSKTLDFLTLFDCFTFLISDSFEYLYESEDIDFIKITAGKKVMFKYDNRE